MLCELVVEGKDGVKELKLACWMDEGQEDLQFSYINTNCQHNTGKVQQLLVCRAQVSSYSTV